MLKTQSATVLTPPPEIVSFAPPPSASYKAMVDGKLEVLPFSTVVGTVGHRFDFSEGGGTGSLLPGRPLTQSVPINLPANAGFFVMLNGFTHAFVHNSPPNTLAERPLGQIQALAGINASARTLNCQVRLTDSNSDDPIRIIVDVVAVFFT